jgi:hypothetical protein
VRAFWHQQLGYGKAEALVERNHPDKFNSFGQAAWRGVIYGPRSILPIGGRVYAGRFGEAPFQRLYGGQNHLDPSWVAYPILVLCLLALLNPYLLVLPGICLSTLIGFHVWRGMAISLRERLRPSWRLGPLLGLLYFLPSLARAWGRLIARSPHHAPPGAGPASRPLRSVGAGTFGTEELGEGRTAFLEGLRLQLKTNRLRPRASSEWDEADIICDSALFWRARVVSYEAWGMLYLRLAYRPRLGRLAVATAGTTAVPAVVPAFGSALALHSYPTAAAVAIGGLLAIFLLEGWSFVRRLRRALTGSA